MVGRRPWTRTCHRSADGMATALVVRAWDARSRRGTACARRRASRVLRTQLLRHLHQWCEDVQETGGHAVRSPIRLAVPRALLPTSLRRMEPGDDAQTVSPTALSSRA